MPRTAWVCITLAGLALAILSQWPEERARALGAEPGESAASEELTPTLRSAPIPDESPPLAPVPARAERWGQDPPVAKDPLSHYLATSIYPPHSRPLGEHNDDLLNPERRHEDWRPTRDGTAEILFSGDRYHLVGDQPLTTYLQVRRDGRPLPVIIRDAYAELVAPVRPGQRSPLQFRADGTTWIASVSPAAAFTLTGAAVVRLTVVVDHGAEELEPVSLLVHVTPPDGVPARFTGRFRDAVVGGSLRVEAELDVTAPGYYLVDANLRDAEGGPVAWTRAKGQLPHGRSWVTLEFFGKVLVDAGRRGPYRVTELRGLRFVEARDPDEEHMPSFDGEHVTADYALDLFSDAEWDSPQKRATLSRLRDQLESGPKAAYFR